MATILLIVIGALVVLAVIASLVQLARDGYHPEPTRHDLLQRR